MIEKPVVLDNVAPNWGLKFSGLSLRVLWGEDLGAALLARIAELRAQTFGGVSLDPADGQSLHLLIQNDADESLAAACRVRHHNDARSLSKGYTGQFYDLLAFDDPGFPVVELGRLCTRPLRGGKPAALRLIWAGIAELMGHWRAKAIIGCASFPGADSQRHRGALGRLAVKYCDPKGQGLKASVPVSDRLFLADCIPDAAMAEVPPLLRSYLSLGAWIGPEAVIDRDLDTLHVLTVLEAARFPPARRAALSAFIAACGRHSLDRVD